MTVTISDNDQQANAAMVDLIVWAVAHFNISRNYLPMIPVPAGSPRSDSEVHDRATEASIRLRNIPNLTITYQSTPGIIPGSFIRAPDQQATQAQVEAHDQAHHEAHDPTEVWDEL